MSQLAQFMQSQRKILMLLFVFLNVFVIYYSKLSVSHPLKAQFALEKEQCLE